MSALEFLDSKNAIYVSHLESWKREERRLHGSDAVLDELIQFAYEESTSYTDRKRWARWLNFARIHTTVLAGHLRRAAPTPDFGQLGEVRTRAEIGGDPSDAELFYYNCDGVGSDGSQLPAFMDGVQQRALATGYRWLMVEMPSQTTLDAIRLRGGRQPQEGEARPTTDQDIREGFRPFLVEYSPLSVTNWRVRDGVLVWAIIRIPVETPKDFDTQTAIGDATTWLVRAGYEGLGDEFTEGGWWKYAPRRRSLTAGMPGGMTRMGRSRCGYTWGEPGTGTWERPSIGQSSYDGIGAGQRLPHEYRQLPGVQPPPSGQEPSTTGPACGSRSTRRFGSNSGTARSTWRCRLHRTPTGLGRCLPWSIPPRYCLTRRRSRS